MYSLPAYLNCVWLVVWGSLGGGARELIASISAIMPLLFATLGPPPLPLVDEAIAVARFAVTGVDDVVEDVVKLACTAGRNPP